MIAAHPGTYRLIFMEDPKFTAATLAAGPIDAAAGCQAFAELKAENWLIEAADPQLLAEVLWTTVHGIVSLELTCPQFPATAAETLVAVAMQALFDGRLRRHESLKYR